jgi:mRNA interferase RelE/StbE
MNWLEESIIDNDALKGLKRHGSMADRIMRTMREYADGTGAHTNNVKALQGSSALRLRIGDYRVVFSETETEIVVTGLGPRGHIYD